MVQGLALPTMPTKTHRFILCGMLITAACGGPLEPELSEGTTEDVESWIGSTASGLCTDGPADAVLNYNGSVFASSPLTTDQYDGPGCSDRWVVEVQGVNQAQDDYRVWSRWRFADLNGLNQSSCSLAFSSIQLFEYTIQSWNCGSGIFCYPVYGWSQYGSDVLLQGVWEDNKCRMKTHASSYPVFSPSFFRSKVRIAVRNFGWALFFPVYKKAEAGIHKDVYYFD